MRSGLKPKLLLVAAASAAIASGLHAQEQTAAPDQIRKLVQSCDAHKFETTISITEKGETRHSDVRLCGTQGQSDADWIHTLKDSVDQTAGNLQMPQAMKEQIIAALNTEIARLTAALPTQRTIAVNLPPPRAEAADNPNRDYSSLPPLPPPVAVADATVASGTAGPASIAAAPRPPAIPGPRLDFKCLAGRDMSTADICQTIGRGDTLLVTAGEDSTGATLRFFRRGDERGETQLGAMRSGQSVVIVPPRELCAGVVHSQVEIRAVRGGSSEARFGPFDLDC